MRSQELAEKKKSDKIKSALADRKRAEREAVERGKSAFYLKVGSINTCIGCLYIDCIIL